MERLLVNLRRWGALAVATSLLAVFVSGATGAGGADPSFAPSGPIPVGRAPSSVVVAFDDLAITNGVLTGQYPAGLIDWGGGGTWYSSGPWGLFTTHSVSFASDRQTSATFTLLSLHTGLVGLQAYNGGSNTTIVTISCSGQPDVSAVVPANHVATIDTGWANACATVTLTTTNGWYTNFDNLRIVTQP